MAQLEGMAVSVGEAKKEERADSNEVYRFCEGRPGRGVRVFYRNAGEKAGQEVHTYSELFFIISGEIEFELSNGDVDKKVVVSKGMEIELNPLTWHATKTLTDVIYMKYIFEPSKMDADKTYHFSKQEFKKIKQEKGLASLMWK